MSLCFRIFEIVLKSDENSRLDIDDPDQTAPKGERMQLQIPSKFFICIIYVPVNSYESALIRVATVREKYLEVREKSGN